MEYIKPEIKIKRKRIHSDSKEITDSRPDKFLKEEYYFESITLNEIIDDKNDYIVVGESGIGKTSFLLWTAAQILSAEIESNFIPLFVKLKDIAKVAFEDDLLPVLNREYHLNLDGLDQVEDYGNIVDRLRDKDIFGKENKVILTTRPIGYYEWVKSLKYEYLRILPFDEERIRKYPISDNP